MKTQGKVRYFRDPLQLLLMAGGIFLFHQKMIAPAWADHPFDPRRYAFELFSEDECALSRYAGSLDEKQVSAMLEKSWAELDSAAARAEGLPEAEARAAIQNAVRGTDGIADKFDRTIRESAVAASGRSIVRARMRQALHQPFVWVIAAFFVILLIFINRPRRPDSGGNQGSA